MIVRTGLDAEQGRFQLYADASGLLAVALPETDLDTLEGELVRGLGADITDGDNTVLRAARHQLADYLAGGRTHFDVPLRPTGTAFQKAVWQALQEIPYGATASYADIAAKIGRPGAARAVGQANRRNPIPVIVPCHRVVAADGGLGGYMGTTAAEDGLKAELLRLETE